MSRSRLGSALAVILVAGAGLVGAVPASAQSVMQQCGQQYQAAKAANTLNGMSWNQYRTECATRLKATPAAAQAGATPAATPAAAPAPNPLKPVAAAPAAVPAPAPVPAPAATTAAAPAADTPAKPMSAGRAAFVTRERQCGAEWKANKVSLKAATPGLTWPKYLSACNTRLKAAGQ